MNGPSVRAAAQQSLHQAARCIGCRMVMRVFLPIAGRANARSVPPRVQVLYVAVQSGREIIVVVQHGTRPAQQFRIDELAGAYPAEVAIVQFVVAVQHVQVVAQHLDRFEIVHVQVRPIRSTIRIVIRMGAHRDWQHVAVDQIGVEFVGDVVAAIGILKCQIEFVLRGKELRAFGRIVVGTFQISARAVDVNLAAEAKCIRL